MRRAVVNHIGGALCGLACVALLVAGSDEPNAIHEAWFWWLKAAALALAALAAHLYVAARRHGMK